MCSGDSDTNYVLGRATRALKSISLAEYDSVYAAITGGECKLPDDGVVMLVSNQGDFHGMICKLSLTSALVFESIQEGLTLSDAADRVVGIYGIPHETALADALSFAVSMEECRLIERPTRHAQ